MSNWLCLRLSYDFITASWVILSTILWICHKYVLMFYYMWIILLTSTDMLYCTLHSTAQTATLLALRFSSNKIKRLLVFHHWLQIIYRSTVNISENVIGNHKNNLAVYLTAVKAKHCRYLTPVTLAPTWPSVWGPKFLSTRHWAKNDCIALLNVVY